MKRCRNGRKDPARNKAWLGVGRDTEAKRNTVAFFEFSSSSALSVTLQALPLMRPLRAIATRPNAARKSKYRVPSRVRPDRPFRSCRSGPAHVALLRARHESNAAIGCFRKLKILLRCRRLSARPISLPPTYFAVFVCSFRNRIFNIK